MNRTPQFIKIMVVLGLAGFAISYLYARVNPATFVVLGATKRPEPQDTNQRAWANVELKESFTLGQDESGPLFNIPFVVKTDPQDNVYVLDMGDRTIKVFDSSGVFLREIGRGLGQGPGEFMRPTDFSIDSKGNVWVADVSNSTVTVFDAEGEVERVSRLTRRPVRILTHADGRYVVMLHNPIDHLFEVYSRDGEKISSFGELIANQARNAIALEGYIVGDGDQFIYTALYTGLIAAFSFDGAENYRKETVQPVPLPVVKVNHRGVRQSLVHNPKSAFNGGVVGDNFYIVTRADGSWDLRDFVDVYDKQTGQYRYSLRFPTQFGLAYWYGEHIYTVQGVTVTKWEVSLPSVLPLTS